MTGRSRILWFGSAGGLVLSGLVCALLISGGLRQILAFVLIGSGLVLATSLVFLEVGLSEDHERDRERRRRPAGGGRLRPARLERARSHHRRLR